MNRPKNQTRKKRGPLVVGIDIHPDIFCACLMTGKTNSEAAIFKRYNDIPIDQLERWAKKALDQGDLCLIEASANTFEAVRRLEALGIHAHVLESHQTSLTAASYLDNDIVAAERIARSYLTGLAKIVWVPDEKTSERRQLLHAYRSAKKNQTQAKNRLVGFLNELHIRLEKRDPLASETQQWLEEQRGWSHRQKALLSHRLRELEFATGNVQALFEAIRAEVLAEPLMRGCLRLGGVAEITAFAIVATVGDIHRFASPEKLVNYLGLNPGRKQSGKGKDIGIGIGRRGRKDMRSILIQGAQSVMNKKAGDPLRDWGWSLHLRKGNRNVAVAAVARKLVMQLWHLLKGNAVTREEQRQPMRRKISAMIRGLSPELRQALDLPAKTKDGVEKILAEIESTSKNTHLQPKTI